MAIRLGLLHDALLDGGAREELARGAAEEVASYERQMADLRSDLTVLKWMVATTLALVTSFGLGLLWTTVNMHAQLAQVVATLNVVQATLTKLPR